MRTAEIQLNQASGPSILGIPFEPVDIPFVEYWRNRTPFDFDESNKLAPHQFRFEMNGIMRGQNAIHALARHTSLQGKVVLDVGSGNGGMCIAAAEAGAAKVHGLELMGMRRDLSRKWAECRGVEIDVQEGVAENLPYPDESVDVLFMFSVIEHVDSHARTLQEITRVLRPGGYAVIEGPNRLSPAFFARDPHYHLMAVSALPRPIAKWWVCHVRKVSSHYDVGIFPIFSLLVRQLKKLGFEIVGSEHDSYLIQRFENPDLIQSGWRILAQALKFAKLDRVILTLLRNTAPMFKITLRKPA